MLWTSLFIFYFLFLIGKLQTRGGSQSYNLPFLIEEESAILAWAHCQYSKPQNKKNGSLRLHENAQKTKLFNSKSQNLWETN